MVLLLLRGNLPHCCSIPVQMWKLQWYVVEAVIQPPAGCLPPAYLSSLAAISGHVLAGRDMLCYCQVHDKTCVYRGLGRLNKAGEIKRTEAVSEHSNGESEVR
jgi:hypothetical protein